MSLPVTGQTNWGVPLNDYITTAVLAVANQALTSINSHTSASDPHGDRAYAAGLVNPITTGVNLPNGYVVLNSGGTIPPNLFGTGTIQTAVYDVKRDYGATGNGSTDDSAAINNALAACAANGGGEVWVPDGVFAVGHQLIIGANTWLHLSPGAVIKRIIPPGGTAPSILCANVNFAASPPAAPAPGNILISGGEWDAVGSGLSTACTPIMLIQASNAEIDMTYLNGVANSPLIELNGCNQITLRDCTFTGAAIGAVSVVPAVRLNSTSTSTTPAGMAASVYNNATCNNILLNACAMIITQAHPSTGRLIGSDLYVSPYSHDVVTVSDCYTAGSIYASQPQADFTHVTQGTQHGCLFNASKNSPSLDLITTGQVFLGPGSASGSPVNVYVAGELAYATGYSGDVTPETWHTMSLNPNWSAGTDANNHSYPPAYKMLPDGSVALRGVVNTPATGTTTGIAFATLDSGYGCTFSNPCSATVVSNSGGEAGQVYLDSNGNVYLHGGFGQNINVWLDGAILRRT